MSEIKQHFVILLVIKDDFISEISLSRTVQNFSLCRDDLVKFTTRLVQTTLVNLINQNA